MDSNVKMGDLRAERELAGRSASWRERGGVAVGAVPGNKKGKGACEEERINVDKKGAIQGHEHIET